MSYRPAERKELPLLDGLAKCGGLSKIEDGSLASSFHSSRPAHGTNRISDNLASISDSTDLIQYDAIICGEEVKSLKHGEFGSFA